MEELQELVKIVRHKSQRSIQLVNQNFRKKQKSKDNLLYEGILKDNFQSDEIASSELFNSIPGNRNYRNTKARLKQKLLNHLYFLDYNKAGYTGYQKAKYECYHSLHQIKILIMEDAGCLALKRLPQLIKTALDFEFIEIAIEGLLMVRNELSHQGKCTPLSNSETEIDRLKPLHKAIIEGEEIYHDTIVMINKSISSSRKIVDEIPDRINALQEMAKKYHSKRLDLLAKKLKLASNRINHDYACNLAICNDIESRYIPQDISKVMMDLDPKEIAFIKLHSLYALNHSEEGIHYAAKKSNIFKSGSDGWFKFKEYHFLLFMKAEKFNQATKVFRTVRINKNFNGLSKGDRERWMIYRAYLLFVNDAKLIKWGFDIEEFKKNDPKFPKKLLGYTIATLIIQFLFYLREGNIKEVRNKMEHLTKYSSIHLDKRHNYRNSIFIRMLEIVLEKEFNSELVEEKSVTYYQKLVDSQIPPDLQQELEIIPYEKLWEFMIQILKTNKYYIHYRFYNYSEV